jgi:hypothetical protein
MSTQNWYPNRPNGVGAGSEDERPLGELFGEMTKSLQVLVRKELELAKVEMKDQASQAGKAAGLLVVAAVVGFIAAVLLSFAAVWGLAETIPTGLAFLAVGLIYVVVAGLLAVTGKKRIAAVNPVPRQAVDTLREDVEVAKSSLSRGAQA